MEVAVIDWKSLDSKFVKDELYEHINAPKWVDFSAPEDSIDDEAWFCRPGCNHPKTVEDFSNEKQRTPTSNSKLKKSATVSNASPFADRKNREPMLKKRGVIPNHDPKLSNKGSKYHKIVEDGENHDPNLSTPINHKLRAGKEAIKSSAEKKEFRDDTMMGKEQTPKLKSTLSARNLFSGGDILSKVAEFCNDLKKLAVRTKDKESAEKNTMEKPLGQPDKHLEVLSDKEKEWKPLLEASKEKSEAADTTCASKTPRRKKIKNDDTENTPVSIDLKKVKAQEGGEGLMRIRTCPPTPQCFSAGGHKPLNGMATPPKHFRPQPRPLKQERGILLELKDDSNEENDDRKAMIDHRSKGGEAVKDVKTLDVFWFLKPCTN